MEKVILETFEGPLDLLLHLIREHKVDIYDIPIFEITQQYLEYLSKIEEYNIEIASEFLLLASTLVSIKVRMLLPGPEEEGEAAQEQDPRMELVERLLEYQKYKNAAAQLSEMLLKQGKSVFRPEDEHLYREISKGVNPLEGLTPDEFRKLYSFLGERLRERQLPPYEVKVKEVSLKEKIQSLMSLLQRSPELYFEDTVNVQDNADLVLGFLALLDLYKQETVSLIQTDNFAPIRIRLRKEHGHVI